MFSTTGQKAPAKARIATAYISLREKPREKVRIAPRRRPMWMLWRRLQVDWRLCQMGHEIRRPAWWADNRAPAPNRAENVSSVSS